MCVRQKLCLLLCSLWSSASSAEWFSNKLDLYNCPSPEDAYSCNQKCNKLSTKDKTHQVDLKTNIKNNVVIYTGYENGKIVASTPLQKCKIVDVKNWICHYELETNRYRYTYRMVDGSFSGVFEGSERLVSFCAKN